MNLKALQELMVTRQMTLAIFLFLATNVNCYKLNSNTTTGKIKELKKDIPAFLADANLTYFEKEYTQESEHSKHGEDLYDNTLSKLLKLTNFKQKNVQKDNK